MTEALDVSRLQDALRERNIHVGLHELSACLAKAYPTRDRAVSIELSRDDLRILVDLFERSEAEADVIFETDLPIAEALRARLEAALEKL